MSFMEPIGRYFPPRVLPDINIFRARSSTELAYKLLALQRVAAAALGVYLFFRYRPLMHSPLSKVLVAAIPSIAGYCLSAPATFLALGGVFFYKGSVKILSGVEHQNIERIFVGVWAAVIGYVCCHQYRKIALCIFKPPNLLDKVFVSVGNQLSVPVWRRFFHRAF